MMVRPIVSPTWLAQHLSHPEVLVVDVRWYLDDPDRGRREFDASHIPGAVFADLETDLSAPTGPGRHPLPPREVFAATMGRLGVGNESHVVAYDDRTGAIAARLWWMLRHIGHTAVSVLDGGYANWRDAGLDVSYEVTEPTAATLSVAPAPPDTIDRATLAERLGRVVVLDARDGPRYRGETEPVDAAAGHIPTSLNAPFTENLNADGTFKSPEELARRFTRLGIEPHSHVVASCGSGVTACHNILAMHIGGSAEATLYPGSWSDWSAAGMPVAAGPDPGSVPDHYAEGG